MADLKQLEAQAERLRNRIQEIRIDFPEAADARRDELARVNEQIAKLRWQALDGQTEPGEQT